MYIENTVSRSTLPSLPATADKAEQYQRAVARGYFARSTAETVIFVRRGRSGRAPAPSPTEVVYILASGGKYGRSSSVRRGAAVRDVARSAA